MRVLILVLALCCSALVGAEPTTQRDPAARPSGPPPLRMTAELTGPVSLREEIPLTLKFSRDRDARGRFINYSFMFVLLDEKGQQVGGPHVFIREAIHVDVDLDGKESTYKPRLVLYRDRKGLVVGQKYQLVCVMPDGDLACAVWFTLAE